jgi:succinoglycan biosynthesis transport protein ExoP
MDSSFSRFAESIRAIKVAADLARVSRPNTNKVIAVTSALPNEGKSTVAAAFAQVIAQGGARVILVDGDLRNPSLSRHIAPNARAGLIEVISGKVRLEEALWTEPEINLKFLPAVLHTRLSNSGEILASPATKQLFDQLRGSYDHIIVDLPPLAPVVDVRATTELIDSYVFVIEWGRTKIDVVEHTLHTAPEVYDGLLGVVLNKADLNRLGRYDGLQGNYYYNRYYSRYGYTD